MLARRRSPWATLLFLGALATAILATTSLGWRDHSRATSGRQPAPTVGAGVCVTPQGLCQAPASRAGDPCSCPHLLRGMVPGHIERLGTSPVLPHSNDWARNGERTQSIYDWDNLVAP